jgi:hypothetical protein
MNGQLDDVMGIGLPFVRDSIPTRAIQLGSVITFDFDSIRRLHMLICHNLGEGGWEGSERHVRFGLDYLDYLDKMERPQGSGANYSIVRIGTGRVGIRDGADPIALHRAMADSHLVTDLYVWDQPAAEARAEAQARFTPLRAVRAWSPGHGVERIPRAVAA